MYVVAAKKYVDCVNIDNEKALNLRIDKIERKINDDEKSTLELPFFAHFLTTI